MEVRQTEKENQQVRIIFRCSAGMGEIITHIAEGEKRSKSEVLRELVQRGLVAGGYVSGQQELGQLVQDAVNEAVKPQIERLASISAKAAQISAANFFMQVYSDKAQLPDYEQDEIDEVAAKARRLGIEYLRLSKGKDLDEFLASGSRRMTNGGRPE